MLSPGQYLRWHEIQSWQLGQVIHTACARGVEPCKGVAMNTTGLARKIDKELDKMYRKAKKEYEKKLL